LPLSPPEPPKVARHLRLSPPQIAGVLVFLAIVGSALAGILDSQEGTKSVEGEAASAEVSYPTRFRYQQIMPLEVTVRNTSPTTLSGVEVSFAHDYISNFSSVEFSPSVSTITADAYVVSLGDIEPGGSRVVTTDMQAEAFLRHSGNISVTAQKGVALELTLSTWVFP
jgi:hypothetical protein